MSSELQRMREVVGTHNNKCRDSLFISTSRSCSNMVCAFLPFAILAVLLSLLACMRAISCTCAAPAALPSLHAAYTPITTSRCCTPSKYLPSMTIPEYLPHPRQSRMHFPALLRSSGMIAVVHSPAPGNFFVCLVALCEKHTFYSHFHTLA